MWSDFRFLGFAEMKLPIIEDPMAGGNGSMMTIAVSAAGELGSSPCAIPNAATTRCAGQASSLGSEIGTIELARLLAAYAPKHLKSLGRLRVNS